MTSAEPSSTGLYEVCLGDRAESAFWTRQPLSVSVQALGSPRVAPPPLFSIRLTLMQAGKQL